jgi:type II secretory pathway pseudopilin PulG
MEATARLILLNKNVYSRLLGGTVLKVRRKKGLTIIELVVAMAILMISMMAITSIVTYSVKSESKSSVRLDTSSYAKAVIEVARTQTDINFKVRPSTDNCYVYFNDMEDLKNKLNNSYFITAASVSDVYNIAGTGSFDDCKSKNINNRRYATHITRASDSLSTSLNILYNIEISVWDLKRDSSSVTHREFSISR